MDNKYKILIEIHHGIGDIIQFIPIFDIIQKQNSLIQNEIHILCQDKVHMDLLLSINKNFKIKTFKRGKTTILETIDIIRFYRRMNFDLSITSPISNKLISFLLMILICPKKIFLPFYFNFKIGKYNFIKIPKRIHQINKNLFIVNSIFNHRFNLLPKFNPEFPLIENFPYPNIFINKERKPLLSIVIGTNTMIHRSFLSKHVYDLKKWPLINYHSLVQRLFNQFTIILIGGKKEFDEIKSSKLDFNGVFDLTNKLTIIESIFVIKNSNLTLGADTGLIHAADALGIPNISLYGPTNPYLVGPLSQNSIKLYPGLKCENCINLNSNSTCLHSKKTSDITINQVYNSIMGFVNEF